jgi:hypothetical protein
LSGGGGGGWYGGAGGGGAAGGGGSGWIFTDAAFKAWKGSGAPESSDYALNSQYYLKNAKLFAGNANNIPNPRDNDTLMTGMRGNGYVRISWAGTTVP